MSQTIFRTSKDPNNPYFMMDNRPINDERLSWKAKGLLAYFMSKPDNWQFYQTEIERRSTDGREAVRSGIRELQELGYMERRQVRDDGGKFIGYEWVVFENPNRKTGNPYNGKPATSNTDLKTTTTIKNHIDKAVVVDAENPIYGLLKQAQVKEPALSEIVALGLSEEQVEWIISDTLDRGQGAKLIVHRCRAGDSVPEHVLKERKRNDPEKYRDSKYAKLYRN